MGLLFRCSVLKLGFNILDVIILTVLCIKTLHGCPLLCKCTHKEVNCKGLAGDIVPMGIPIDTVVLRLENNQIKKITKNSFRQLTDLKVLKLSGNMISKIEEGSFDDLINLVILDLTKNHLAELPLGIFTKLKNLEILHLSENSLVQIDGMFIGLKTLQKLYLDKNHLTEITNRAFEDLEKLHQLKLSNNNISNIHSGAFKSNQKLILLALSSNPIERVDNLLQTNLQVQFLDLTKCQLTKFPQGMPWTVKYLKLSENNITRITKAETLPYTFLSVIVLEDNNLSYVEKGAFSHMGFLTDVFLIVNNLDVIPGPFPQSVRSVYLDRNRISSIPMESFQHGTSLTVLSLRSNELTDIQASSFANLRSLRELHLERNPIKTLHNNVFLFVRGLQYMTLNRLNLQAIYSNCFLGLDSLQKLEMSFIHVEYNNIYGNLYYQTPNLKSLSLEESPALAKFVLENEAVLTSLHNLTTINLMNNGLTTIKPLIQKELVNLQEIKLGGNQFLCDTNLIWLRKWLMLEPDKFYMASQLRCHFPYHLQGRSIIDVSINEFHQPDNETMVTQDVTQTTTPLEYYHYDYYDSSNMNNYYYNYDDDDNYEYYSYYSEIHRNTISGNNVSAINTTNTALGDYNFTFIMTDDNAKAKTNDSETSAGNKNKVKAVGIAAGMSVAVVFVMLLIAGIVYCLWKKKRHIVHDQTHQYKATDDYVFIVSKKDIDSQPKARRLTREERGSTTSKASEDITNSTEPIMKVYTLND